MGAFFFFANFHLEGIGIRLGGSSRSRIESPAQILQETSSVPENESTLRTARYTGGTREDCTKNTGEKGTESVRTAQNTHIGRLKRGRTDDPR